MSYKLQATFNLILSRPLATVTLHFLAALEGTNCQVDIYGRTRMTAS